MSSLVHFHCITGRFLLLGFAPDWVAMSLKVQQSLLWEQGSGGSYTPYSVEMTYLAGSGNETAVSWVLWSQNSLGCYPAFKFQIRMFQNPEYADIFFKIQKFHFPIESHALVEDGKILVWCSDQWYSSELILVLQNLKMQLLKIEFPRSEEGNKFEDILLLKTRK